MWLSDWTTTKWVDTVGLGKKQEMLRRECSRKNAATAAKLLQSCLTLCNPIDGSPPGSPVPGILQARTLEWVAISFSNAWKWKVKVKSLSRVRLWVTPWTAAYQAPPPLGFSRQEHWSGLPFPSPMHKSEKVKVKLLSCVRPSATPWTAALQAPPSMRFSRQEYWSGVPLPSPERILCMKSTEWCVRHWVISYFLLPFLLELSVHGSQLSHGTCLGKMSSLCNQLDSCAIPCLVTLVSNLMLCFKVIGIFYSPVNCGSPLRTGYLSSQCPVTLSLHVVSVQ